MRFLQEETAVAVTEYAIMVALIILTALIALTSLGNKVSETFHTITRTLV